MANVKIVLFIVSIYLLAVGLALAGYFLDQEENDARIEQLAPFGYGWACLSVIVIFIGIKAVGKNAGTARKKSGVDRPDQHAYEVVEHSEGDSNVGASASGKALGGAAVRMSSDGPLGEFNRAQRAAFNWQENLPVTLAELMLIAAGVGRMALVFAVIISLGRVAFALGYTSAVSGRIPGFALSMLGETSAHILVFILGIRALLE
eukprot:gnl/MRDRNA2_/MRDRNA2_69518_c0_seq1.p1 gnl/MRDRNA2_/MRDRNA2_69518_c0~~gnl/MRDRNA2_/MRDRNA2_69518_c0_seq1.p1  ORF type:complete len:205 (-),score=35.23 gnl/MRDRNA2_/MRDRNA2_69518_c0_seq1:199-813(-)